MMRGYPPCSARTSGLALALLALFGLFLMPFHPVSAAPVHVTSHAAMPCDSAVATDFDQGHPASHPSAAATQPHHGAIKGAGVLANPCAACCLPLATTELAPPMRIAAPVIRAIHAVGATGRDLEPAAPPPRSVF
jgi:hypothetical protein